MHSNVLDNAKCIPTDSTILKNNPIVLGCTHDYMEMTTGQNFGQKPKLTFLIFFILVSPRFLAKELKIENRLSYISHM